MLPDARGISEPAKALGLETPADFVRAYPMFREWLALLIRRMDAKASIYRSASSLSPTSNGPAPTWSSTAGASSTPRSPCKTPQIRRSAPGA